ncbi:telomere repeat binding factor-domain-containing protein [Lipomyces oligophaga]|uniref:telomere repeat binding factor-domain-containing protein n=1 Tax=Lipomyces oligophaga TaxID=45792 RepID=UPI0034CE5AA6
MEVQQQTSTTDPQLGSLDQHEVEINTDIAQHHLNEAEDLMFIAQNFESTAHADEQESDEELQQQHNVEAEEAVMEYANQDRIYDIPYDDLSSAISSNPAMMFKVQSMPILDNLSEQVLGTVAKRYPDAYSIFSPITDEGQAYRTLLSLFEQTKKLYSCEPFLSVAELGFSNSPVYRTIVRKANLATFVSTLLSGSGEVGFQALNDNFIQSFVPEGSRLLKSQGQLFLDLKTHAFLAGMAAEQPRKELLADLFPNNMEDELLRLRAGPGTFSSSEQDFIERCKHRRESLVDLDCSPDAPEKYIWNDFLRDLTEYVAKNYTSLVSMPKGYSMRRHMRFGREDGASSFEELVMMQSGHSETDPSVAAALANATSLSEAYAATQSMFGNGPAVEGYGGVVGLGMERSMTTIKTKSPRNRALVKGNHKRRLWTKEEENALLKGLDEVKGPKWSMILELYGPGGRVSEVLKDRNQVQLKDKARNLKLFFLKSGLQVPYYLRGVTGDLKRNSSTSRRPGDLGEPEGEVIADDEISEADVN